MGLAGRNRRRITVDGVRYWWWVAEDLECSIAPGHPQLMVATDDRRLHVQYHLAPEHRGVVTVLGPAFRAVIGAPRRWFVGPALGIDAAVQPRHVAALIAWLRERGPTPVELDHRGAPRATPRRDPPLSRAGS